MGASNSAGFGIDHKTGIIFVNERLDRESQNRYVLTVLAKNRGSIRGDDIDEAQVIIQVEDGNDPPVFRRDFYLADVAEVSNEGLRFEIALILPFCVVLLPSPPLASIGQMQMARKFKVREPTNSNRLCHAKFP